MGRRTAGGGPALRQRHPPDTGCRSARSSAGRRTLRRAAHRAPAPPPPAAGRYLKRRPWLYKHLPRAPSATVIPSAARNPKQWPTLRWPYGEKRGQGFGSLAPLGTTGGAVSHSLLSLSTAGMAARPKRRVRLSTCPSFTSHNGTMGSTLAKTSRPAQTSATDAAVNRYSTGRGT